MPERFDEDGPEPLIDGPEPLTVDPASSGDRLDRALAEHLSASRNQIQQWIRDGRVTVDGAVVDKPSARLEDGQRIAVDVPPPQPSGIEPEEGALRILHQDRDLVVLDKPAGLTVHPGAGRPTGTLVHRLLAHFPDVEGVGGPGRPGIVHRLDKDTSGVLVVARTQAAYRALQAAFASRSVDKRYLAVVYGEPAPAEGEIDAPIGRHPDRRTRMSVRPDGRPALSRYRTLAAARGVALLEVDIATGRTHQIRVHLKSIHHPIVGDPVYGEARWKGVEPAVRRPLAAFPRPALHAWTIAFDHPTTGARVSFEAPVPDDLRTLWIRVAGQEWPAR